MIQNDGGKITVQKITYIYCQIKPKKKSMRKPSL